MSSLDVTEPALNLRMSPHNVFIFADRQNALIYLHFSMDFQMCIFLICLFLECIRLSSAFTLQVLILVEVGARELYRDDKSRRGRRRRGNRCDRRFLQQIRGEDSQKEYFLYDVYLSL